jgi:hypothetical protein
METCEGDGSSTWNVDAPEKVASGPRSHRHEARRRMRRPHVFHVERGVAPQVLPVPM